MRGLRVIRNVAIVILLTTGLASGSLADDPKRPNPFATLSIGDVTRYKLGDKLVTYVFDGRDELGYRQRRFEGHDIDGEAADTEWFDEIGRKIRRKFANGLLIKFEPYACFGVEGECVEEAFYSDERRKTYRWIQVIEDGKIEFSLHELDRTSGRSKIVSDGGYSFDKVTGTTLDGDWFESALGRSMSIRLISGPEQP